MMSRSSPNFLRKAFDAMVKARTRQARQEVAGALFKLDDTTLKFYGYSHEELQRSHRFNAWD